MTSLYLLLRKYLHHTGHHHFAGREGGGSMLELILGGQLLFQALLY